MITIKIKQADRFIEIIESMPEPIVKIDNQKHTMFAYNKGGVANLKTTNKCYDLYKKLKG